MNRIEQYFRDPTLEQPTTERYWIVRVLFGGTFIVGRDDAARILSAIGRCDAPIVVRCQTVMGSVVYVRSDTIVFVQECSRAQRDAARRFWKEIDDEDDELDSYVD